MCDDKIKIFNCKLVLLIINNTYLCTNQIRGVHVVKYYSKWNIAIVSTERQTVDLSGTDDRSDTSHGCILRMVPNFIFLARYEF